MMNTVVRPYFDRCLAALKTGLAKSLALTVLVFVGASLLAIVAHAEEEEMAGNPDGLVEVHLRGDPYATYLKRRGTWSGRFNLQWESFFPSSYVSPIDQAPYANIFGSNQGSLISLAAGIQRNTPVGALYIDGVYGAGTIPGVTASTGLTMSKFGGIAGVLFDRLFENPWVSPFVAVEGVYFNWKEMTATTSQGGTTALTIGTMAGLSIHMNRVDEIGAAEGYINYGIKNTFIDVYAVQYNTSNSAGDPDFQTGPSFGAGFHLEF